jgi:hypothetical protein
LFNTSAGDITQTLPNITTSFVIGTARISTLGTDITLVNAKGTNDVKVVPAGTQRINGFPVGALVKPGMTLVLRSDGVENWYVVAAFAP